MADELEPLGSLAKRALDAESSKATPDDDAMRDRVFAKLSASLALGAAVAPTPPAPVAKAAFAAKAAPWIAGAFLAGGVIGASVHAAFVPSPTPPLPTESARVLPSAPPSITTAPTPVVSIDSLPSVPTPGTVAPKPVVSQAPSAATPDTDLAAERALVERARMALARGQADAALEALGRHASTFPKGRLSEERDALTVQALSRAGRTTEAKSRADQFHRDFPKSVFGPAVDAATKEK